MSDGKKLNGNEADEVLSFKHGRTDAFRILSIIENRRSNEGDTYLDLRVIFVHPYSYLTIKYSQLGI
jgi:hypothetical protein